MRGTYVDQKLLPGSKDKGGRVFGTFVDHSLMTRSALRFRLPTRTNPIRREDWNAWGYGGLVRSRR